MSTLPAVTDGEIPRARLLQVAARLGENEAVELDISGPKPRLTISALLQIVGGDKLIIPFS